MRPSRTSRCLPLGAPPVVPVCVCCSGPNLGDPWHEYTVCDAVVIAETGRIESIPPTTSWGNAWEPLYGGDLGLGVESPFLVTGQSWACDAASFYTTDDVLHDLVGIQAALSMVVFEVPDSGSWSVMTTTANDGFSVGGFADYWYVESGNGSTFDLYPYPPNFFGRPHVLIFAHDSSADSPPGWLWMDGHIYAASVNAVSPWPAIGSFIPAYGNYYETTVNAWWFGFVYAGGGRYIENESEEQAALFAAIEAWLSPCVDFLGPPD